MDLNAGDVTTFLNMKPSYTISDVTTNISRLDKSFLQGVIANTIQAFLFLQSPSGLRKRFQYQAMM